MERVVDMPDLEYRGDGFGPSRQVRTRMGGDGSAQTPTSSRNSVASVVRKADESHRLL